MLANAFLVLAHAQVANPTLFDWDPEPDVTSHFFGSGAGSESLFFSLKFVGPWPRWRGEGAHPGA